MGTKWFKEISQFGLTCNDGDDVWFVGDRYSFIFQMSLKSSSVKRIVRIKGEKFNIVRKYWRLEKAGNKLFLIPCNSDKIVIFHIDVDRFSFIELKKALVNCLSSVKEGNVLYLIDEYEIIVIDTEHEQTLEYIPIPDYGKLMSEVALWIDGHIIIPLIFQSGVIDFCIAEKSFCYVEFEGMFNGFVTGVADGRDIWLAGDQGSIVRWNYISKETTIYDSPPAGFESFNYDIKGNFISWGLGWTQGVSFQYWYACFLLNDKIWFIPQMSNSLLYIDKKSNSIQKFTFNNENETDITVRYHRNVKFLLVGIYKKQYIKIYSKKRDIIYSIDSMNLECTEENINIDSIEVESVEKEYLDHLNKVAVYSGLWENSNISIEELAVLVSMNHADNGGDSVKESVGKNVYMTF